MQYPKTVALISPITEPVNSGEIPRGSAGPAAGADPVWAAAGGVLWTTGTVTESFLSHHPSDTPLVGGASKQTVYMHCQFNVARSYRYTLCPTTTQPCHTCP